MARAAGGQGNPCYIASLRDAAVHARVEQNSKAVLGLPTRYVLETGAWCLRNGRELLNNTDVQRAYLGRITGGSMNEKEGFMTDNRRFETIARDDLAQLQIERLQTTLNRVSRNVAFYKHALDARKISPESVRSMGDLRELPLQQEDLRVSYPSTCSLAPARRVRIHASSGTTGKPIVVGYSKNDILHWSSSWRASFHGRHYRARLVQIGFSYSLFTGAWLSFRRGKDRASVIRRPRTATCATSDHHEGFQDLGAHMCSSSALAWQGP